MVLNIFDEHESNLLAHRISKSWAVMYSSSARFSDGLAELVVSQELDAQIAALEHKMEEADGVLYTDEARVRALSVTSQNLRAVESTLRNIDYGMEFSRLTAEQIRFRAGLALLSHAGLAANTVLSLLKTN